MSNLENLFMQIFDRRTWIVDHQLKPHLQSYKQSLASHLLINGIHPPSWLWNSTTVGSDAEKADPTELKKEELISGLLFPPPRPPHVPLSTGNCALYSKHTVKGDDRRLSDGSAAETCGSNKCFDAVDRPMAVPKSSVSGNELGHKSIVNEVPELPPISTFQIQTDARTSEIHSEPDPMSTILKSSLTENVLGQKILNEVPILNPISASAQVEMDTKIADISDQLVPNSSLNDSDQGQKYIPNDVPQLNPIPASPQVQMDAKASNTFFRPDQSLQRFQRSRSRQKALELRNSVKTKTKWRSLKENIGNEYAGRVTRSRTSCLQPTCVMESLKPKTSSEITSENNLRTTLPRSARQLCYADESLTPTEHLNQVGEDEPQKEACADMASLSEHAVNKVIQSDDVNDIHPQAFTVATVATELASGAAEAAHSVCSELKMVSANSEVGLAFIVSRPPTDADTFIEPKQLVFDDIEDCSLKLAVSRPLEEEKQETSLEMRAVSKLVPCQSSNEVTETMNFWEMNGISAGDQAQDKELLQADEQAGEQVQEKEVPQAGELVQEKEVLQKIAYLNRDKEAEDDVSHASFTCKHSNLYVLSLKNRKSISSKKVCVGALGDTCPVSNGMSNHQAQVATNDLSPSQVDGRKSPLRRQLLSAMDSSLPEVASKLLPAQSSKEVTVTMYFQEMNCVSLDDLVQNKELLQADELMLEKEVPQADELMQEKEVLQSIEILNREKEAGKTLIDERQGEESHEFLETKEAERDVSRASFTCKPLKFSTLPLKNRLFISIKNVCGGAQGDTSPVSNGMSNHQTQMTTDDLSLSQEDGRENSSRSQLPSAVDFNLPGVASHPQTASVSDHKCIVELDVEPTETLLEDCEFKAAANNSLIKSTSTDFTDGTAFPVSRKLDMFLEAQDSRVSSVATDAANGRSVLRQTITPRGSQIQRQEATFATDAAKRSVLRQTITPKGAQIQRQAAAYNLRSSSSYSKKLHSSKSKGPHAVRKSGRLAKPLCNAYEYSWPMHKRRKTECQSDNILNTSPRVRIVIPLLQGHEDRISKQSKSSEDASEVILECQHFPVSHEVEVEQSNVVTESHRAEEHRSKKRRITKESRALPKLQLSFSALQNNEGDAEMKGEDQSGIVASKGTHAEVSLDTSVRSRADRDSLCCLKDVGETAEPATVLDAKRQHTSNDALYFLCFDGRLRGEGPKMSDSSEGTLEGIKSTLGKHGLSSSYSVNSYIEDLDLLGADKAIPEFRGFNGGVLRQEGPKMSDSPKGTMDEIKSTLGELDLSSSFAARSLYHEDLDLFGVDKTVPESEGFSVGVPPQNRPPSVVCEGFNFYDQYLSSKTKERVGALEQLCRSTCMLTPISDPSTMYKIQTMPDVCQSLPNGLLEHTDLRKACLFNLGHVKQPNGSEDGKLTDGYSSVGAEIDGSLLGRSYSNCMASSSAQYGCDDTRPPYSPPLGKLCPKTSSGKHVNRNPERTCFQIDEDTCINQENMHLDEVVNQFQKGISSRKENIPSKREVLAVVSSKYHNSPKLDSAAGKFLDRGRLDSMNMELNSLGTQKGVRKNLENGRENGRKYKNEDKENRSPSVIGNGAGKATEHHPNRFSRPKLSRKASEKKGSQTFSEKGCKPMNIVSNISSFIPLVQQKQQTAVALTGKRDIKVKALEAAEAAKRLEEKREIERKMRKEAAKLEREKQEIVKQLELKKKEGEKKKKEVDMAARKRQREEEERKEKERKRKCIEEARKQQKEREEKVRAEKDEKELHQKAAADEERKRKELAGEARKQQKREKGREGAGCTKKMVSEARLANVIMGNAIQGSSSQEDRKAFKEPNHIEKVVSMSDNLHKATEDGISFIEGSKVLESYVISPYQGSDNEEEEEDADSDIAEKKCIPLWARGKCVVQSLFSLKHIDPTEIFLRERCSRLSEVLLPRQQKLS